MTTLEGVLNENGTYDLKVEGPLPEVPDPEPTTPYTQIENNEQVFTVNGLVPTSDDVVELRNSRLVRFTNLGTDMIKGFSKHSLSATIYDWCIYLDDAGTTTPQAGETYWGRVVQRADPASNTIGIIQVWNNSIVPDQATAELLPLNTMGGGVHTNGSSSGDTHTLTRTSVFSGTVNGIKVSVIFRMEFDSTIVQQPNNYTQWTVFGVGHSQTHLHGPGNLDPLVGNSRPGTYDVTKRYVYAYYGRGDDNGVDGNTGDDRFYLLSPFDTEVNRPSDINELPNEGQGGLESPFTVLEAFNGALTINGGSDLTIDDINDLKHGRLVKFTNNDATVLDNGFVMNTTLGTDYTWCVYLDTFNTTETAALSTYWGKVVTRSNPDGQVVGIIQLRVLANTEDLATALAAPIYGFTDTRYGFDSLFPSYLELNQNSQIAGGNGTTILSEVSRLEFDGTVLQQGAGVTSWQLYGSEQTQTSEHYILGAPNTRPDIYDETKRYAYFFFGKGIAGPTLQKPYLLSAFGTEAERPLDTSLLPEEPDIGTGGDGDGGGGLSVAEGLEELETRIQIVLRTLQGTNLYNEQLGVAYFANARRHKNIFIANIRDALYKVNGVETVSDVSVAVNSFTRVVSVSFRINHSRDALTFEITEGL